MSRINIQWECVQVCQLVVSLWTYIDVCVANQMKSRRSREDATSRRPSVIASHPKSPPPFHYIPLSISPRDCIAILNSPFGYLALGQLFYLEINLRTPLSSSFHLPSCHCDIHHARGRWRHPCAFDRSDFDTTIDRRGSADRAFSQEACCW